MKLARNTVLALAALASAFAATPASSDSQTGRVVPGINGEDASRRPASTRRWQSEASFGQGGRRFRIGATPVDQLFRYHSERAAKGDLRSIHKLADLYLVGRGVGKDERKAAELYRKAALGGYRWSKLKYAWMLEEGRGVAKDPAAARELMAVAEKETFNSWAMYRRAKQIAASDPRESRRLLELAAQKKNVRAITELKRLDGKVSGRR